MALGTGIVIASAFDMNSPLPVDARFTAANVTARDAIPSGNRFDGLQVYTVADQTLWQLQGGIANINWVSMAGGSGTFPGDVIVGGYLKRSVAFSVTAFATGGQASATILTKDINRITACATNGDSVKFQSITSTIGVGASIFIQNDGAKDLAVFPAVGEYINGLAINTSLTVKAGKNIIFYAIDTNTWKSFSGGGGGDVAVFGTLVAPRVIVAATGINSGAAHMDPASSDQIVFVEGSVAGANDISALNPAIEAGTVVGQKLKLRGVNSAKYIALEGDPTKGVITRGALIISGGDKYDFWWNGSQWEQQ